jgi:predicted ATP-dependent endonuclease of OLD family
MTLNSKDAQNMAVQQTHEELSAEAVNLSETSVNQIQAETVRMHNSAAGAITADEIEANQSLIQQIQATQVDLRSSLVALVSSNEGRVSNGGIVALRTSQLESTNCAIGIAVAEEARISQLQSGGVIATKVHADSIRSAIILANQIDGSVETLLDTPRAILAGLTAGVAIGLVMLVGRLALGRNR